MLSFYSSSTNGIKNTYIYRVENGANLAARFHSQSGFFIVQFSICPVFSLPGHERDDKLGSIDFVL